MNRELDIDEIFNVIKNEKFVIYGAGSVGKRFAEILKKMDCFHNVVAFAITNKDYKIETIYEREIKKIDEIGQETKILIAVHDVHYKKICELLQEQGYKYYYWIYPYLFDIYYGLPIEKNVRMRVQDVVKNLASIYTHAIYYLAIKSYFTEDDIGKNIYIKYMKIFSERETSVQRYEFFERKIKNCRENGFIQNDSIKLSVKKDIILDGTHRLMLAYWFDTEYIQADIYDADMKDYLDFSNNVALTEEGLKNNFELQEINLIKGIVCALKSGEPNSFLGEIYEDKYNHTCI